MMKTVLLLLAMAGTFFLQETLMADPPLEVSIAVSEYHRGRFFRYNNRNEPFHVVVRNVSDKPVRVWESWNSWGYDRLTFEVTDSAGKTTIAERAPCNFTRNFPSALTIEPGESYVLRVKFEDKTLWQGFPRPTEGTAEVTIRAVFAIEESDESKEHNVWTGKVVSKAVSAKFSQWP